MSEKLHQQHEKAHESLDIGAEATKNLERIQKAAEGAEKLPKAEHARHEAAKEALPGKDVAIEQTSSSESGGFGIERQLKSQAYQKSLDRIRSHLSAPERAFSKFTHTKAVDKTSTIVGNTVARPTGILGGAITAFLGSLFLLYASKHYGFRYNYLLFTFLFVAGYIVGAILEFILWAFIGRGRQKRR